MALKLMLIYEPTAAKKGPVHVASVRHPDPSLAKLVAQCAIREAQHRARQISATDEILGEVERSEARRIAEVIQILLPDCAEPAAII